MDSAILREEEFSGGGMGSSFEEEDGFNSLLAVRFKYEWSGGRKKKMGLDFVIRQDSGESFWVLGRVFVCKLQE